MRQGREVNGERVPGHVFAEKRSIVREYWSDRSSIDIATQLLAGIESPSRQATARETAARVREVLDELREKDREIILLYLFEGLTGQESAAVLGMSTRTVDRHWAFARAWLRTHLLSEEPKAGA